MAGLTDTRDVHQDLRTGFENDEVETARNLAKTLSAMNWLSEDQIASLIDSIARCCQTDFDTIEAARDRLVGRWRRGSGWSVGPTSSMVTEAEYYFSMSHEFEYTPSRKRKLAPGLGTDTHPARRLMATRSPPRRVVST
jgi:hypothetical protein